MTGPILGFRVWRVTWRPPDLGAYVGGTLADTWIGRVWEAEADRRAEIMRARNVLNGTLRRREPDELPPGLLLPLSSVHQGAQDAWRKNPASFRCDRKHVRPVSDCTCGLHAWFNSADCEIHRPADVQGAIVAWGHIVFHGLEGFRAQHARVVALAPVPRRRMRREILQEAAAGLNVPLVAPEDLERVGREHGEPVRVVYQIGGAVVAAGGSA